MTLKPTKSEKGIFSGCLLTSVLGAVIGASVGIIMADYIKIPGEGDFLPDMEGLVAFLGAIAGLFLGGILGLLTSTFAANQERDEEEF